MSGARRALVVAALIAPALARAQPALRVDDACPFEPDALLRALGQEGAPPVAIDVRCDAAGTAVLTVGPPARARLREVDLRDVPPALAPRVVALVAATLAAEVEAASAPPPPPPPPPPPRLTPPGDAPQVDAGPPPLRRPTLVDRAGRWSVAARGRAFVRSYAGLPLWGGGAGAAWGPLTVGAHAAGASLVHRLGTATAWVIGVDAGATIACSRGRPLVCVGARAELARQAVTGHSSDPAVMATALSTVAVHGAAELSLALPVGGLDLIATGAVGGGTGLVARANAAEIARLAGWTVGAALEVRR